MRRLVIASTLLFMPVLALAASNSVASEFGSFALLATGLLSLLIIRNRQG